MLDVRVGVVRVTVVLRLGVERVAVLGLDAVVRGALELVVTGLYRARLDEFFEDLSRAAVWVRRRACSAWEAARLELRAATVRLAAGVLRRRLCPRET
jgi:hypothetical protein